MVGCRASGRMSRCSCGCSLLSSCLERRKLYPAQEPLARIVWQLIQQGDSCAQAWVEALEGVGRGSLPRPLPRPESVEVENIITAQSQHLPDTQQVEDGRLVQLSLLDATHLLGIDPCIMTEPLSRALLHLLLGDVLLLADAAQLLARLYHRLAQAHHVLSHLVRAALLLYPHAVPRGRATPTRLHYPITIS